MYGGGCDPFVELESGKLVLCHMGRMAGSCVFAGWACWRSGTAGAEFRKTTESSSLEERSSVGSVSGGVTSEN
jgi:hypothetical protein